MNEKGGFGAGISIFFILRLKRDKSEKITSICDEAP